MTADKSEASSERERILQRLHFAFVTMGFDPAVSGNRSELAGLLSIDTDLLERWLEGQELPPLWQIAEIARFSGLSVLWLLAGQGPLDASHVHEGLVLKTSNDELIGMASPVDTELAADIIALANDVNEAAGAGELPAALADHIGRVVASLSQLLKAVPEGPGNSPR